MKRFVMLLVSALLVAGGPALAGVKEKQVKLPDDLGSAVIYTRDKGGKPGPGVIVIHEWWGLNDYARDRARMLAKEGFTAIAVDMYGHGEVADHPDNAKAFMNQALSAPEQMNARFNAAKSLLAAEASVDATRIFAMGYCFGGAVVLNQARMGNDLAGVASFHGSLGSDIKPEPGAVKARVLVAHGGADPFVPPDQVATFVTDMLNAGADLTLVNYPDAVHSFTNPGSTEKGKKYNLPLAYNEQADKDSWARLLAFIRQ